MRDFIKLIENADADTAPVKRAYNEDHLGEVIRIAIDDAFKKQSAEKRERDSKMSKASRLINRNNISAIPFDHESVTKAAIAYLDKKLG